MKRLILTIALCILGCLSQCYAQNTQHIVFKNTPLNGSVASFAKTMQRHGFQQKEEYSHISVMSGTFANRQATLYIGGTPKTNTVWKVRVVFPRSNSWGVLRREYASLKSLYANKYGTPRNSCERFTEPHRDGDGQEMEALKEGMCKYYCAFTTEGGVIWIEIDSHGYVAVNYQDYANLQLNHSEKLTSLTNDI